MIKKLRNNKEGFTLIELMIVIAIIGILAAIAIPQFAAYRVRSFNSSAQSDIRNLATAQAALFSDWQMFGGSDFVPVPAAGAQIVYAPFLGGAAPNVLYGPSGQQNNPAVLPVIEVTAQLANRGLQIPLGNNVELAAYTEGASCAAFTAVSKHRNGNTHFGVDSDITAVYFDEFPGSEGAQIVVAAGCNVQFDDFANVAGPSGNNWAVR